MQQTLYVLSYKRMCSLTDHYHPLEPGPSIEAAADVGVGQDVRRKERARPPVYPTPSYLSATALVAPPSLHHPHNTLN